MNRDLNETELDQIGKVADIILAEASKGLGPSLNPEFDRIYPKGYRNGFTSAMMEAPDVARELIKKHLP
jgi:hypothetical protein